MPGCGSPLKTPWLKISSAWNVEHGLEHLAHVHQRRARDVRRAGQERDRSTPQPIAQAEREVGAPRRRRLRSRRPRAQLPSGDFLLLNPLELLRVHAARRRELPEPRADAVHELDARYRVHDEHLARAQLAHGRDLHFITPPGHDVASHLLEVLRLLAVVELRQELPLDLLERRDVLGHREPAEVDARAYVASKLSLDARRLHLDHDVLAPVSTREPRAVHLTDGRDAAGLFLPPLERVRVAGLGELGARDRLGLPRRHLGRRLVLRELAPLQVLTRHEVVPGAQQLRVLEVEPAHVKHQVANLERVPLVEPLVRRVRVRIPERQARPARDPDLCQVAVAPLHRAVLRPDGKGVVPERHGSRGSLIVSGVGSDADGARGGEPQRRAHGAADDWTLLLRGPRLSLHGLWRRSPAAPRARPP